MKKWAIGCLITASLLSCRNNKNCSPDQACTMQFVMLDVEVKNANNQPNVLDSYKVMKNMEVIQHSKLLDSSSWNEMRLSGVYRLADDGNLKQVERKGSALKFYGYRHGSLIIDEPYTVGHDCCHVQLLGGNRKIKTP